MAIFKNTYSQCVNELSSDWLTFGYVASTQSITIYPTSPKCIMYLTPTDNRTWITTAIYANQLQVTVTENTGPARSGTVTIDGIVVAISQSRFIPTVYSVTGGGRHCEGTPGTAVGVSGSQIGVTYQLKRNGVNYGSPVNGTGSALNVGNAVIGGTYTVVATSTASGAYINMSGSATVTALAAPLAPSDITNDSRCGAGMVTLGAYPGDGGNQVKWYNTSNSYVYTGESYSPSLSSTTTYFVKSYSTTTGCYSTSSSVVRGVINSIPAQPINLGNDARCGSGTVDLSAKPGSNGNQVKWYSHSGSYIQTGNTYSPDIVISKTYYVKTYNSTTGCISSSASVTGTVNAIPDAPANVVNDTRCGSGTVNLSAQPGLNGNQVKWYTLGGTYVKTENDYSPSISSTTNYNVKTYNSATGCISSTSTLVTGTVIATPNAPINVVNDARCGPGIVTLSAELGAGGDQLKWYSSDGTFIHAGDDYSSNISSTTNYNIKTYNSTTGCYSTSASVTGTVNSNPENPVNITNAERSGFGEVTLTAEPGNVSGEVLWYKPDNAVSVYSGNSFTVAVNKTTAYTVTTLNPETGCESSGIEATATINDVFNLEMDDVKSNSMNYKRKITPKVPVQYLAELNYLNSDEVVGEISYSDGLGRNLQSQVSGTSYDGESVVQIYSFDKYGRVDTTFLPFTEKTEGNYLTDARNAQTQFYLNNNDKIVNDNSPFAKVKYDNSPLSLIDEQGSFGQNWQLNTDHIVKNSFNTNTDTDNIKYWQYNATNENYVSTVNYASGTLYKNTVTDENDNTVTTYTDLDGKLILKDQEGLRTYYIYDYYGRLTHILPPEFVEKLSQVNNTVDISNTLVKQYCYTYIYGQRSLLIEKRLPGIKPVEYVYDQLNRPVLSRNGNLKMQKQWSFVKYDKLGRVAYSGLWTDNNIVLRNRNQIQSIMDAEQDFYETYNSATNSYSNNVFPESDYDLQVQNVYDVYTALITNEFPFENKSGFDSDWVYNTSGMLLYSKVKILDAQAVANFIETLNYYDEKGRIIQKQSSNVFDKRDIAYYKYNFMNQVEVQKVEHTMPTNEIEEVTKYYTYDNSGRLKSVEQEIAADNANGKVKMEELEYNKLGQLITKKLHEKADGQFLQNIDYDYNIHGQLTSINDPDNRGNDNDLFAMHLYYNEPVKSGSPTLNNHLISGIEWTIFDSKVETKKRSYAYTYDNHYRLTQASYSDGATLSENLGRYDVNYTYTTNGKINTLIRNGLISENNYGVIDNLTYTYIGNQLANVEDFAITGQNVNHFADLAHLSQEYEYDDNGNMYADANKGLSEITYNHLNLPELVYFDDNNYIIFTYDALGNKLKKEIKLAGSTNIYIFIGGFVYENNTLSQIATDEGQVMITDTNYKYEYYLKDHLGSIRVMFGEDTLHNAEILQETHYYPFGMHIDGLNFGGNINNKLFSGKELISSEKFNGANLDWYDFQARNYDPQLGMWFNVDPMAEKYTSFTPYNYCFNNPVNFIDPTGMDPAWLTRIRNQMSYHGDTYAQDGGGSSGGTFWGTEGGRYLLETILSGNISNIPAGRYTSDGSYYSVVSVDESEQTVFYSDGWGVQTVFQGLGKWNEDKTAIQASMFGTVEVYRTFIYNASINNAQSGGGEQIIWSTLAAFSAEDIYNNFGHNHTTYTTTKGVTKNIFKANGQVRSARAAKFAGTSTTVKVLGTIGTALATANASYNIANGSNNVLDYSDATVGAVGLINAGAMQWTSFGIPVVGQAVAVYFGARAFFDLTLDMTNYYMENNINPGNQFIIFKE